MTESMTSTAVPRPGHRVLFVSDPSTIVRLLLPDPAQEKDLRQWVDMVADSGVDMFAQEVFSQGWTHYWQSDTYDYDRRIWHRRFKPLFEAGTQPLNILIDQSHQRGMTFIAGFRMNDGHTHQSREQGVGISEFIDSHQNLQLTELPEGDFYKLPELLDFSFEQVRNFTFGVIEQVANRFDIDGIELCFRDYAYFPAGQGHKRAALMTDLIERIRAMLDERGSAVGKKLVLGARVFSTVDECAQLGLDVRAWISQGLLDYVSPQDTMYCDFNLPYHEWTALTRASDCMLYPGMLPWMSHRARYRRKRIPISWATSRALAHTMYRAGADGVSLYNHYCACVWNPPFYPHAMHVCHQLRDPDRVARGERHYVFDPTWAGQTGFGAEGRCGTGKIKADRIVLDRTKENPAGQYQFYLYEDLHSVHDTTFIFRGFGMTENDELEVRLNGSVIPDDAIRRCGNSRALPIDGAYLREHNGKQITCNPEAGWIDARETAENPGPMFSTRWFSLSPSVTQYGENCLSVTLLKSDPQTEEQPIVIDELEIYVEPH